MKKSELNITAIILAGGGAVRMGGVDKGLQQYRGSPLVSYMVRLAHLCTDNVMISANRNQQVYQTFADEVYSDELALTDKGPLSGVLSVGRAVKASHIMLLPCDTPNTPLAALTALIDKASDRPDLITYIETESGAQPLHAILPKLAVESLENYLDRVGHYGVMGFYRSFGCQVSFCDDDSAFENINVADQLI